MQRFFEKSGVIATGIATSLVTAVIVTIIHNVTGFNVFGFTVWFILPIGAGLCGFAAASGYYLAAKYLHMQPSRLLLLQMVIVAAFTQMAIYWLEYKTLNIDGANVSHFMPFGEYLNLSMTTAHYKAGRAMQIDGGEVGSFGYWLAAIDFVGFVIGGAFVYLQLIGEPSCDLCKKYLQVLTKKTDIFDDGTSFSDYYDNEFIYPVESAEFANHVGRKKSAGATQKGTISIVTRVMGCPTCRNQMVSEKVTIYTGKDWQDLNKLTRLVPMPDGADVSGVYQ